MAAKKRYRDVDVNLEALKSIPSIDELKKTDIFSHIDDKEAAYKELWEDLKPAVSAPAPKSAPVSENK